MSISIKDARDLLLQSPERLGEYTKVNLASRKANVFINVDKAASSNDTNMRISIAQARKLLTEIY